MSIRLVPVVGLALALLAGCTASAEPSPEPTGAGAPDPAVTPDGFSLERLLVATPDLGANAIVSYADVAAAAEHAGLARPEGSLGDLAGWVYDLSGTGADDVVSVPWPASLGVADLARHEEFVAAAGFGLADVDAFAEVAAPPRVFTVAHGSFDVDAITAALGEPVDGVWAQDGEELVSDLDGPRAIDRLGRPVRIAGDDEVLVLTLERDLARGWIAGSTRAPADLLRVARALDAEGVYAARLLADGDGYLGVGLAFRDGASAAVAVRSGGTAPQVGATDGRYIVDAVETGGGVHIVQLTAADEVPPATVWQLFGSFSPLLGAAR